MNTQRGITQCDTIEDIFHNPILMRLILRWYKCENKGKKLRYANIKAQKDKDIKKYHDFIREIFENKDTFEKFLIYVRESVIISATLRESIYKSSKSKKSQLAAREDIITALLSFYDIHHQLNEVSKLTISGVFQTRIIDIIRRAKDTDVHEEEDTDIYSDAPLYYALERTLTENIIPISDSGDIICKIANGTSGHVVSIIGLGGIFEVDTYGKALDESGVDKRSDMIDGLNSRRKIVKLIERLEAILIYHSGENIKISQKSQRLYLKLSEMYGHSLRDKKHRPERMELYHQFGTYVSDIISELAQKLRTLEAIDMTWIQSLRDMGIEPGVRRHLPQGISSSKPPHQGVPKLKVIR